MPRLRSKIAGMETEVAGAMAPTLAEITSALSFALDLTEGAVPGTRFAAA